MKCPKCGEENDDGIAICQNCDFILDPSFLGEDYDQLKDSNSDDLDALSAEEFSETTPQENDFFEHKEHKDEEDEEIERQLQALRKKRGKQSIIHSATDIKTDKGTDKKKETDHVEDDLKKTFESISKFFKILHKADKIALLSALGMFLFTIFPWVSISNQGSLSGLEVGGWFLLLLGASLGALIYLRQDAHWQAREKYVLYAQAVVVVIALLFLLTRVISISSLKPVSPDGSPTSMNLYSVQVGFGFLLSLASTVGASVATWILFKEKVLKK